MLAPILLTLALGQSANWEVNSFNTLFWNGKPYIPVGATITGTQENVEAAIAAGIKDLVVEMPVQQDWAPVVSQLEKADVNYFVSINSLAPAAEVAAIDPESFRIPDLRGVFKFSLNIPGVEQARVVLASETTGNVRSDEVIKAVNGKVTVQNDTNLTEEHVLIVYPVLKDQSIPDLWEGFDAHRDQLLSTIRSAGFGSHFRGLINPMGRVTNFLEKDSTSVPTSSYFRMELQEYLERKYGTFDKVNEGWSLSVNGYQSIDELCQLVPLWTNSRGVEYLWDLKSGRKIRCEAGRSDIWADIRTVLATTTERRYTRLIEAIQAEVNVPVIQDWAGWGGPYEQVGVPVSGVGYQGAITSRINGIDQLVLPASSTLRRLSPTVCLATGLTFSTGEGMASPWEIVEASQSFGVRGWFFRANTPEEFAAIKAASKGKDDLRALETWKTTALYYPISARNPASPTRLPGGLWWIPSPASGERIDFGEGIEGYRYSDGALNFVALWSTGSARRVKFKVRDPKTFEAVCIDGTDLEIKAEKDHVEMYVPTVPCLVFDVNDVPVPIDSFNITAAMSDILISRFGRIVDVSGNQKYELQRIVKGFDRNPAGSFIELRKQWRDLLLLAAPYKWIEAEKSVDTNFSNVQEILGSSDRKALVLDSRMTNMVSQFYSRYILKAVGSGEVDLWIAGRIPASMLPGVTVNVAGKTMHITSTPINYYGDRMAWYKVGRIPVVAGEQVITISTPGSTGGEIILDTLMATPDQNFQPEGPHPPVRWLLDLLGKPEEEPPQSDR